MTDANLSLWQASAKEQINLTSLSESIQVDVAIIGAGYSGLSCALTLAKQGVRVAVLEANTVGYGGSGRNVGLVNAGLWMPPDEVEAVLGVEASNTLYEALAQAPDMVFSLINDNQIECEATRNGTLHAGVGRIGMKQLESRYLQLNQRQAPVVLLDENEARARIGSNAFSGALFDPRAGTIQPLSYALGLARAAISQSVSIYQNSQVVSIDAHAQKWRLKSSSGGEVLANKVVMATNAYPEKLFPQLQQSFVPIQYSQFASQALPDEILKRILPNKEGVWDTCTVMSSLRLDQSGRLIFGGMGGAGLNTRLRDWADKRVKQLFDYLPKLDWQYAWSGQIAFSHDHLPHCHLLDDGIYSLVGYSGRGIGPGTVMGKELALHLINSNHKMPLAMTQVNKVSLREMKRSFYEVGAHIYHYGQVLT
ncbi:sarcosine oxidase subunit beta [Marinomonas sp. S3726]|uniref:NAD(P)/FAD-dependent oxidoreductase n=1 Tax=Marinomonas sp. S3726 TaxID=579484 RepID=UPI0005FA949D|nr:FAD-binding oxidoreductase [Marinomonas sp. S3726]KJZ15884.1 sarcosine oxidase subunit beta [Marinomonas sp. S3726]